MASYTENLNLKKPAYADKRDIKDINDNMDILDAAVYALKNKGSGNSGKLMAVNSDGDVVPVTDNKKTVQTAKSDPTASGTAASFIDSITQNTNGEITATKKMVRDATTGQSGLMSAADKTKLNGIAENANNYSLPLAANGTRGGVQVGYSQSGNNYPVQLSGEKMYVNIPDADEPGCARGLMHTTDKTKLDGISTGANKIELALVTQTKTYTISGNLTKRLSGTIGKNGYTAFGLVGFYSGNIDVTVSRAEMDSNGSLYYLELYNTSGGSVSATASVTALFIKTT